MAGICLIRLVGVRPAWLPAWMGISSENAAHRVAVEWDGAEAGKSGGAREGGRIFPGVHHRARFAVDETTDRLQLAVTSDDGQTNISVRGHRVDRLPTTSIFSSLGEASSFFETGSLGYSATHDLGRYDGLELCC